MSAELTVLGCVLRDNRVMRSAAEHVTGDDFQDPRLGAVFDGMARAIAAGERVDAVTVEVKLPEWGVQGLTAADPWRWLDYGEYTLAVTDAAVAVRQASLRRQGARVFKEALRRIDAEDPATVIEETKRALTVEARSTMDAVSLGDILNLPDESDWVVPGLLERKDRLIITGHEGLGKTTMARQLLILPAAGLHPFTFERIDPVRALVVDAENTGKQWMRAARWLTRAAAADGVDPRGNVHLSLNGRMNILDPAQLGGIHMLIDRHKPDIVFIGPLYRLALRMNTEDEIAPVIAALDSIRDRNVALVMEAHAGHARDGDGKRDVRPRGSSALLGWPEFGFGIRADTDFPGLFEFQAWRGAREGNRSWPKRLRRGASGEFPWHPVEMED